MKKSGVKNMAVLLFLICLLLSCRNSHNKKPEDHVRQTYPNAITIDVGTEQAELKESRSVNTNDSIILDSLAHIYFDLVLQKGKLIHPLNYDIFALLEERLKSSDTVNQFYYFRVFSKSMHGSDGDVSDAIGYRSIRYLRDKTSIFLQNFLRESDLTEGDFHAWIEAIYGEISMENEGKESEAIDEYEKVIREKNPDFSANERALIDKLFKGLRSYHSKVAKIYPS